MPLSTLSHLPAAPVRNIQSYTFHCELHCANVGMLFSLSHWVLSPFSCGFDPCVVTVPLVTFLLFGISPHVLLLLWFEDILCTVRILVHLGLAWRAREFCWTKFFPLSCPPDHTELCRIFSLSWDCNHRCWIQLLYIVGQFFTVQVLHIVTMPSPLSTRKVFVSLLLCPFLLLYFEAMLL